MRKLCTLFVVLALVGWGPVGAAAGASELAPAGTTERTESVGTATSESAETATSVGASGSMSAPAATAQNACDFESLYDDTIPSVVTVRVTTASAGGFGSGFVYDGDGHVVTNQHVVAGAEQVEVQFDRGQWRTAEVVGTDAYSDLAVLRVEDAPGYADPLSVEASPIEPGEPVAAFGSPLGLQGTITDGIVSGTNRSLPAGGMQGPQFSIPNTVQTTAAINPGNSGGPLVNCDGRVVGVNTASAAGGENTGFAVPASRIEQVVPALIANGSYAHSFLGISSFDVSPTVADANDLDVARGVLVVDVLDGSPADGVLRGSDGNVSANGLQVPAGGDVILRVDGRRVASQEDLASVLAESRPDETVTLTLLRDGERQRVEVELGERPPPGGA